jgi:steroid delta-isomerase-like uncharacterized protein
MASRNVETIRAAHEGWNRRDFNAVTRDLSDNCVYTDHARNQTIRGKQEFTKYVKQWADAWTDGRIKDTQYIDGGNVVVCEFTGEGTNDGPFGELPATRRHATFAFCEIWHFDAGGKMTSGGGYYDLYSLLSQLGHISPVTRAA